MSQEYFSITHKLSINMEPVLESEVPETVSQLNVEMPLAFKMANNIADIDSNSLRLIRGIGEQAEPIANLLQMQNDKINLMMSYILAQQNAKQHRFTTRTFSAGGLSITTSKAFNINQLVRLKIFLPNDASAIYCYGVVSAVLADPASKFHTYTIDYSLIRELDRETLIRSTLNIQQQQLKERAESRLTNNEQ